MKLVLVDTFESIKLFDEKLSNYEIRVTQQREPRKRVRDYTWTCRSSLSNSYIGRLYFSPAARATTMNLQRSFTNYKKASPRRRCNLSNNSPRGEEVSRGRKIKMRKKHSRKERRRKGKLIRRLKFSFCFSGERGSKFWLLPPGESFTVSPSHAISRVESERERRGWERKNEIEI